MATIRESLKKLTEVAKPVPGDEQEFVAKHVIKTFDLQGKDAIHKDETPYEAILKNVAAVKSPSERAEKPGENHGHNKPGESEAAYHVPESREQKIAKLSMMMEATIDPKEQQLADALKSLLAETFSLYLKAHHYHWNVMGPDFAQYHEFLGELYAEVHGAVDMIAENIRVLGELAPGNLRTMDSSQYTDPHLMIVDLMMDNEKVLQSLKDCYKLAESMDRLGISNFLQDRLTAHEKHHWMMQAIAGVKGEEPMQEAKQVTGVKMHYHNPKTGEKFHEIHFSVPAAEKFRKQHEKAGFKLVKKEAQFSEAATPAQQAAIAIAMKKAGKKPKGMKEEAEQIDEIKFSDVLKATHGKSPEEKQAIIKQMRDQENASKPKAKPRPPEKVEPGPIGSRFDEENRPLLPRQKEIARELLKKEMEARKKQRNDNRQAGTPKITESEESRREENDKEREARVATPRPHTPKGVEAMRYRLQSVKKQIIDKT
jgi:starvation-inducible DNA-binding protein